MGRAQSASDKNIDDVAAPGWYHMTKTQTIGGVAVEYCYLHVTAWADGAIHCTQVAYLPSSGRQFTRRKQNGTWSDWVDCSPSAFAPSGYGLGTWAKLITDLNSAKACGWYFFGSSATNTPPHNGSGALLVLNRNYTYEVIQIAWDYSTGVMSQRVYASNSWSSWEFVNPPMALGVEYRTTERYKGKPVYVCALHVGYLAKGDNSIEHKLNMDQPISVDIFNNNQEVLTGYSGITNITVNRNYIYMSATSAFGSIDYYLKYTKA